MAASYNCVFLIKSQSSLLMPYLSKEDFKGLKSFTLNSNITIKDFYYLPLWKNDSLWLREYRLKVISEIALANTGT